MRWTQRVGRIIGYVGIPFTTPMLELWELTTQQLEQMHKQATRVSTQHHQSWNVPPKPGERHYERIMWRAWWSVSREIRLALAVIDRELEYRKLKGYQEFSRAIREKPNERTIRLVFADWIEEWYNDHKTPGFPVMARRLRGEGTVRKYSKRRTR